MRVHLHQLGRPIEGDVPGESLVEHAPEGVDVGRSRTPAALDALGRGVVDRAHQHAGPCHRGSAAGPAGDAEVGQVDVLVILVLATRDEDVRRLDVAVDEAATVGGGESRCHRPQQLHGAFGRQAAARGDQLAQVGSIDPTHDQVQRTLEVAGLVDRNHIGVLDRGGDLRLALEAFPERFVLGELGRNRLDGDRPLQRDLRRSVYDSHPAPPGHRLEAATRDRGPQSEVSHAAVYTGPADVRSLARCLTPRSRARAS